MLEYEGCYQLRTRLVLSTLSGRSVRIRNIRSDEDAPGLKEFEANLIRLFDKLTNGSKFEVNETGTALTYRPGLLTGGKIVHDTCAERGVGYYLEPLLMLGIFCKNPLELTLRGVTNHPSDPSPDLLRSSALPVLKKFLLIDHGIEIKVEKRGAYPKGGGQVLFKLPIRKKLKSIQFTDQGKIKRIRGVAWATRVSPAVSNRLVESAKSICLKFIPDVYINTDHLTGNKSGSSPGFGIVLQAETNTGTILTAEVTSSAGEDNKPTVPEDLGIEGAHALLEEIFRGGCVDSTSQTLALLLMSLSQRDVSKIVTGPLSDYTVHFLRHLRDFFQMTFKLETFEDEESEDLKMGADKVVLTCVGTGFSNIAKRTT
ncbi:RNA 3'-terminal phosphate cyclase-like protein [Lepeophtheirus salmonis]|uniref:RNA 3'-terminal phosphate cyclase-like protein n=1 Tax=Lepeophtheirus salmonis TaxID=72036 RepID=UPI001AEA7157|nr:RNA 3'-terminal phosphate cyclase-like protein [Lepeophtheirus salmonis]